MIDTAESMTNGIQTARSIYMTFLQTRFMIRDSVSCVALCKARYLVSHRIRETVERKSFIAALSFPYREYQPFLRFKYSYRSKSC